METLLKILAELRPDVDFEENKELVDSGELDSFDIVSLVGELCDEAVWHLHHFDLSFFLYWLPQHIS